MSPRGSLPEKEVQLDTVREELSPHDSTDRSCGSESGGIADSVDRLARLLEDWGGKLQMQADAIRLTHLLEDWGGKLQAQAGALNRNTLVLEGLSRLVESGRLRERSPSHSVDPCACDHGKATEQLDPCPRKQFV